MIDNSMHISTSGVRRCYRRGLPIGVARRLPTWRTKATARLIVIASLGLVPACWAGEGPFFITYTHQMEEPGNLEFGTKNVIGKPNGGNRFFGTTAEFEYGVRGWWTSELFWRKPCERCLPKVHMAPR